MMLSLPFCNLANVLSAKNKFELMMYCKSLGLPSSNKCTKHQLKQSIIQFRRQQFQISLSKANHKLPSDIVHCICDFIPFDNDLTMVRISEIKRARKLFIHIKKNNNTIDWFSNCYNKQFVHQLLQKRKNRIDLLQRAEVAKIIVLALPVDMIESNPKWIRLWLKSLYFRRYNIQSYKILRKRFLAEIKHLTEIDPGIRMQIYCKRQFEAARAVLLSIDQRIYK